MPLETLVLSIVLLPFASATALWLARKALPPALAGVIGCAAVLVPFLCSLLVFSELPADGHVRAVLASWMSGKGFAIDFAFHVDSLALTWTMFITGIGFLIHVYSAGYMKGDEGFTRFFIYLNLFVGSMLALVLGDSLPLMFLGWEGVGLCSYLLIGFWYSDMENAKAGQKAFVVNRIGDLGFLLGMLLIFKEFGTLRIPDVIHAVQSRFESGELLAGDPTVTAIALLLFVGACGKSAQIPLYTWLPDAMAGPTPVSALIHAATMVTAGIYMVARMSVLYALSPVASTTVAVVGAATALLAATIALRQRDIKKVLAYSTVSQLGYMFLALGIGAYGAAVFHVITHAFFKALLFLGAGSVIHALHHEQDAMKMGGLKKYLPTTHRTFFIGCLALSGIPPFAGFFSKDKIVGSALLGGGTFFWLGLIGLVTALMTAFYTFRLYTLVFASPERLDPHAKEHLHESPASLTMPLNVLMVLAIFGGALSLPLHLPDFLGGWLHAAFAPAFAVTGEPHPHTIAQEIPLLLLGTVIALGGAFWAYRRYQNGPGAEAQPATSGLPAALENKWYVDEIYAIAVVGPMRVLALLSGFFDRYVIDGLVNGTARLADGFGRVVRTMQSGSVHAYALMFVAGAAFLALILL
jgi:NADH-quinone oxidoreductase subunit L